MRSWSQLTYDTDSFRARRCRRYFLYANHLYALSTGVTDLGIDAVSETVGWQDANHALVVHCCS